MGLFATFAYAGGSWDPGLQTEPWLQVEIHDSDIATIDFRPAQPPATGRCYLGFEPRHYYDDPAASHPVDRPAEAAGLAQWASISTGIAVVAAEVEELLAGSDLDDEPEDIFVETTVVRLLGVLGLPVPDDLAP